MSRAGAQSGGRRLPGFSLLELMLVLTIIAIVGAMAVPRYASALNRYRADAAARRIAYDFNLARSEARRSSASRTVTVDLVNGRLSIASVMSDNLLASTYTTNVADKPYSARLSAADLGGDLQLTYDGFGNPDSAGTLTVRSGAEVRTVAVNAVTGQAEVQ